MVQWSLQILIGMLGCLFWAAAAVCRMVSAANSTAELPVYRLSKDIIPIRYNVSLTPDLDSFQFMGEVNIEIECQKETDTIRVHSVSLSVGDKDVTVKRSSDRKPLVVNNVQFDEDNDFLVIKLSQKLGVGLKYNIHIVFSGQLTDGLSGFYRSSYMEKATNTTKWLAVTQFEPTDARRAFPCFDEPSLKARFQVRLSHRASLKAISNMPLTHSLPRADKPGWVWSEFQETVPMSTYLVAFMVSEFDFRQSDPEPNNVVLRVWARQEAIDQVEFARKYGPKFLNFYEDFFNTSYPLPKQDMVAIPDFAAGAMENWGLITYRESAILSDENTTSESSKYQIANTIAHEMAHQWFGNLVTMKWWTDLWLNEGFATYAASLAVHHQFPAWNAYNYEVATNLIDVFYLDGLVSSHPVSVPIAHPSEIEQIFDGISYNKGSLLIHMMNSFLGADVFQSGVSEYIRQLAYSNSEQDDLWRCLTDAGHTAMVMPSGLSVKQIMDTWTLQTGYPVLTVRRDNGNFTVSQKRFIWKQLKHEERVNGSWWIPLTYSTAKHPNFRDTRPSLWLSPEGEELNFDTKVGPNDWVLLNNRAAGIYRVNYDAHTWSLLTDMLHQGDFSRTDELNRVTLLLDAMALAHVGELPYTQAIRLLKYVQRETAFNPWHAALSTFQDLELLLRRTEKYAQFQKMVQSLLSDIYQKLGDLTEVPGGLESARFKQVITKWACEYEVGDCSNKAVQLFKEWMASSNNSIPKDLRSIVYCYGVKYGGEKEWTYIWQQYLTSNLANEKNTFLSALSCTKEEYLINRYLELSVNSSSGVRKQDASSLFSHVAQESPLGYKLALAFFENNIQRIHDYLLPNKKELGGYVNVLTQRMVFPEEVKKMKELLESHQKTLLDKSQLAVSQGLEAANTNLNWMASYYKDISTALNA